MTKKIVETPAVQQEPDGFPLTLDEFCTRLSAKDRRVEMIGGFHSDEKRAGRIMDTEAAFLSRYHQFISKPV